jgi:hypothetical protein
MKAYRILVHDRRDAAPAEWAAEMAHDARAMEFAHARFAASDHIAGIEVWAGSQRLCLYGETARDAA